jgi:L-threonylcarbamoyladenylate synthase
MPACFSSCYCPRCSTTLFYCLTPNIEPNRGKEPALRTRQLHRVEDAAALLRDGKLVAFPTETVFGLGGDARSPQTIERLFAAKGRPADNPLIVHLSDIDQWPLAARELTPVAEVLLRHFAPGPLTVIIPKHESICEHVSAGLDTVGIRIPSAELTRRLLRAAAIPVAAPSANLSGRPSCTNWKSVLEDLDGRIDAVLAMDTPNVGLESSVVDCTGSDPVLLRPGAVSLADLQRFYPQASQLWSSRGGDSKGGNSRVSPGLRHAHYQPRATVRLVENAAEYVKRYAGQATTAAFCGLEIPDNAAEFSLCQRFASVESYAHGFYEFLRSADRAGAQVIYVQTVRGTGLAAALRDRQLRAAGFEDFTAH